MDTLKDKLGAAERRSSKCLQRYKEWIWDRSEKYEGEVERHVRMKRLNISCRRGRVERRR